MERRTAVVMSIAAIVVAATALALPLVDRYRPSVLTPTELALKLPSPPDDSCFRIERSFAGLPPKDAVRDPNPLSADELAIYEAVLDLWTSKPGRPLNLSNTTEPLDRDISDCSCLKSIDIESFAKATSSFHRLAGNVFHAEAIRLVDPEWQLSIVQTADPHNLTNKGVSVDAAVDSAFANGLFRLSEIAFDKDHRKALVSYSFVCGSLCGSGGVWLFERVNGTWKKTEHTCGGWVS